MKKITLKSLMDNNRFLQIFSLAFAAICWIVVVIYENPETSTVINQVPVNINLSADNLVELGLTAIEGTEYYVDVTVRGPRTAVGNLSPEDLKVSANVSSISEAGPHDLTLTLTNSGEDKLREVELEGFSPSTIRVRFDRLVTKTFDVTPNVRGISIEAGYSSDPERVTPDKITITGPQVELDMIDKVIIEADITEPLSRSYVEVLPIQLLDAQGEPIDMENSYLQLEYETAQLMIRVLKIKTLPLTVAFTYIPTGFPLDELLWLMEMSNDDIELAGPVDSIDNYAEILLGYIDLTTLTPSNNLFVFDVEMPSSQFKNLQNITSVTVEFDAEDWDTDRFNVSNISIENPPAGYDVNLLSTSVNGITVVGRTNTLNTVTADDIVVVVDLADKEIQTGQYTYPVKVIVPTKGMVWAVGDYSVTIQVTEQTAR